MIQIKDKILKENKENKFISTEFKQFFLLEFAKQLILNSAPIEVLKLQEMMEDKNITSKENKENKEKEIKERVKEVLEIEDDSGYEKSHLPKLEKHWAKPSIKRKSFPFESFRNVRLTIPEPNLPERLMYLRPVPTKQEIELGKLNPIIQDSFVNSIECEGPNTNIIVKGKMGEKQTRIVLDENEINEIIKIFSDASKIPVSEGFYKVAVGRFVFMAIISEVIGSKFIINKMLSRHL